MSSVGMNRAQLLAMALVMFGVMLFVVPITFLLLIALQVIWIVVTLVLRIFRKKVRIFFPLFWWERIFFGIFKWMDKILSRLPGYVPIDWDKNKDVA